MLRTTLTVSTLASLLLAGNAVAADQSDPAWTQVAYSCDSGAPLTVAYREGASSVRVTVGEGQVFKLVARPAKEGFRYSDSRHELRGEGDEIQWKTDTRTPITCKSTDPAAASLAAAARR